MRNVESFAESLKNYGDFDLATWVSLKPEDDLLGFAKKLKEQLENAITGTNLLIPWSLYVARRFVSAQLFQ